VGGALGLVRTGYAASWVAALMPRVDRQDSTLVVIDTQPGFYRDREDVDPAGFSAFVDRVAWLVAVAVAVDVPVVVTVERPARNGDTAAEIVRCLPMATPLFDKSTFDLTADDAIRAAVEETGRRTAVLVGMETDVCVAQSALGLCDRGFRVAAVADATFSPGEAHAAGLERMRGVGLELVSVKGVFYEWLPSLDEFREFKTSHPELARPVGIQL
jgi:nicotinamidase-related amidase